MTSALQQGLARRGHLILDGPTGTELIARGYQGHPLLWTALAALDAPALLLAIHRDYIAAGAHILTANTFRTSAYALGRAGRAGEARHLTSRAVELAASCRGSSAAPDNQILIAGSLAPLEDCYHPERVPNSATLDRGHRHTAGLLAEAGCDLILAETMGTASEALCAVRAAKAETSLPVLVSFVPAEDGRRLLGGDLLLPAALDCLAAGADAVLVNCAHSDVMERALHGLAPLVTQGAQLGAYANAARMHMDNGEPTWEPDRRPLSEQAQEYGQRAASWLREPGARILGSCCGTTPAHIRELGLALK